MSDDSIEAGKELEADAFGIWAAEHQLSLKMDSSIARCLVPNALYETVEDPSKVGILVYSSENKGLKVLIYYERDISDESVEEDRRSFRDYARRMTQGQKIGHSRLDRFFQSHYNLVQQSKLRINQQVLLQLELVSEEDLLLVLLYSDREELRGRGIAKDFFKQLFEVARRLGFAVVASQNNSGNHDFFIKKLNGTSLSDVNDEELRERIRRLFHEEIIDDSTFTVNTLGEEEK